MIVPKGEVLWVTQKDAHGQVMYIVTSPPDRSVYKLYTPDGCGGWTLAAKHRSAGELVRRHTMKLPKS